MPSMRREGERRIGRLRSMCREPKLAAVFISTMTNTSTPTNQTVRHIVAWRFRDGTTDAQIERFTGAFRGLTTKIDGIIGFEHGANNSLENLNRGLTHVYLLTFESVQARDAYLPHPAHKAFGEMIGQMGIVAEVLVVDYVPQA